MAYRKQSAWVLQQSNNMTTAASESRGLEHRLGFIHPTHQEGLLSRRPIAAGPAPGSYELEGLP